MKNFDGRAITTRKHAINPQLTSIKVSYSTFVRKPNSAASNHPLEHPR